jgi:dephospho-CoA kinase
MTGPYVIAITGGAGAGKTTASRHFGRLGATVIESDAVARDVLEEPETREALLQAFGTGLLDDHGSIDRALLAEAAFKGTQSVARLNAATHPRISAVIMGRLDDLGSDEAMPMVVVEVPLLDAVPDLRERCDQIVAVEAPIGARVQRLVDRGIPEPDARRRIGLQLTDVQRRRFATAVVVNDSDIVSYEDRLDRVWEHLCASRRAAQKSAGTEGGARG